MALAAATTLTALLVVVRVPLLKGRAGRVWHIFARVPSGMHMHVFMDFMNTQASCHPGALNTFPHAPEQGARGCTHVACTYRVTSVGIRKYSNTRHPYGDLDIVRTRLV